MLRNPCAAGLTLLLAAVCGGVPLAICGGVPSAVNANVSDGYRLAQYSFDGSTGTGTRTGPGRGQHPALSLVEVAGCLAGAPGAWQLQNAGDPRITKTQSTSSAERDAHRSALGSRQFDLLGARIFGPDKLAGHTVVVKGVLIGSGSSARINVTSLQSIAGTCAAAPRTAQRAP